MTRIIDNENVTVDSSWKLSEMTHELESGNECHVRELFISHDDFHVDDLSKVVRVLINKSTLIKLTVRVRDGFSVDHAICVSNLLDENINPKGRLEHLDLSCCVRTDEQVVNRSKGLKNNNSLVNLEIHGGKIGESSAMILCNALATNHSLVQLELWKVKIDDAGAEAIAEGIMQRQYPSHSNIVRHFSTQPFKEFKLNLSYNHKISDVGARAFASLLHKQHSALSPLVTLTTLDLATCKIGDEGAVAIAESLKSCNTNIGLKKLFLCFNQIGNAGAIAFANALKQNCSLRKLYLHCNNIGLDGGIALCQTLERYNDTLLFASLEGNPCSGQIWKDDSTIHKYLWPSPRNCDKTVATEENQRMKVNDIFKFIASR